MMNSSRQRVLYHLNSRWVYGKIVGHFTLAITCAPTNALPLDSRYSTLLSFYFKWQQYRYLRVSITATMRNDPVR